MSTSTLSCSYRDGDGGAAYEPYSQRLPASTRVGGCDEHGGASALVVVLVLIILLVVVAAPMLRQGGYGRAPCTCGRPSVGGEGPPMESCASPSASEPFQVEARPSSDPDTPERRSVYGALSRLYSTADVDPLVTGQLYAYADGIRNVYAQRTSHGDVQGLTEYSSSGAPGDTGVDVGPYGLDEYGGSVVGYDDGIPETWRMESTPVRWYGPRQRDYTGPEGATPYSEGLCPLSEPDHDPLVN